MSRASASTKALLMTLLLAARVDRGIEPKVRDEVLRRREPADVLDEDDDRERAVELDAGELHQPEDVLAPNRQALDPQGVRRPLPAEALEVIQLAVDERALVRVDGNEPMI